MNKALQQYMNLSHLRDPDGYSWERKTQECLTKFPELLEKWKQAKKEIDKVVGTSLEKTIQKEIEKTLKGKATRDEIADVTKSVVKKLYKDLSLSYPQVIDRIKV